MTRSLWLSVCLVVLFSFPAQADPRCPLDTSNPAITHTFLPMHGGSFQGMTGYFDPSDWVYHSKQAHWACQGCNGMPFDASLGLLNPATIHIHDEFCWPDGAEITGPITIPTRQRSYHLAGSYQDNGGPMLQNVTFTPPQDVPWHRFQGDPMGVTVTTGFLTYNPLLPGDAGPPIHGAVPNGWSIFEHTVLAFLNNGDVVGITSEAPIWTKVNPNAPEDPAFTPSAAAGAGITSVIDGGSAPWGSQIIETRQTVFPYLAPFDQVWPLANVFGYMYGGTIPAGGVGLCEMRKDMDLHNGIVGTALPGMPASCNGPGFLDPVAIGTGKHAVTLIWQATTGPNGQLAADGVTFVGHPNQTVTALDAFNVEVGDVSAPTTCLDPSAPNFGGPLPCQPPVVVPPVCVPPAVPQNGVCVTPPPVTVWSVGTVFSHPTSTGVQFELCPGSDPLAVTCQPK